MMALSVDQIAAKFPQKSFPMIDIKPYYYSIHVMCTLLYWNAFVLTTALVRGNHCHVGIVIQYTLYATISPTTYVAPVDPVGTATVPLQSTAAQHFQLQDKYAESLRLHNTHHNMDASLKTMVLDAVDNTYFFALHNFFTGYMGSSIRDVMNHLIAWYTQITAEDIKMKKQSLREPSDTSQLIGVLFKLIYDGVRYSRKVKILYTPSQVLQMSYHIVILSGIYSDACKDWLRKLSTEKTWEIFKTFFALDYN